MSKAPLSPGIKAPAFSARNQDGKTVSLKDFKGKKVIIYFYPKDLTPGCTTQSCNLRDNYRLLLKKGYEVIGINADTPEMHRRFADKYQLPFNLLSDPDLKIIGKYDAWGEKQLYGRKFMGILRKTFIINEKGIIESIIDRVKTKEHTDQILDAGGSGKT